MTLEYIEPEWEAKYVKMLDALIEYLDDIGQREDTRINQRDITIITALIQFYDFEVTDNQDIIDILDDARERSKELDFDEEEE